ncbi:hypothetical protein CCHR01_19618 [Colletotrichum chrysophilum]|uniref:Uncharacterized protein n=1 Tax=Colletotrichum chrysophilum TaxID=1836956 RepID=A0AAD8ZYN6_9PEZI|nr:hypothetical protein CCHR01_19618 [Colletotrichum chrysophilum]
MAIFQNVHNHNGYEQGVRDAVKSWSEAKATELTNVGVSGGLIAAVLTTAFSWSEARGQFPSSVRACWYIGLLFSLTSVTLATQQSIALSRARCHPKGISYVRAMLGISTDNLTPPPQDQLQLAMQLYLWQVPVMFLNFSIMVLVASILIIIYRMEDYVVRVSAGLAVVFAGLNYLGSTAFLYNQALSGSTDKKVA